MNTDSATGQMLSQAANLLEYGFLGLSVIMVVMGFWLLRGLLSQDQVSPAKERSVKFFIYSAFAFMVMSGVLQGVDKFMDHSNEARKANVNISIMSGLTRAEERSLNQGAKDDDESPAITVRYRGVDIDPINDNYFGLEVDDKAQIDVELSALIFALRELQSQVKDSALQDARKSEDAGL